MLKTMKKKLFSFTIAFITCTTLPFDSLPMLEKHMKKYEEYPPGNYDWHNPDFSDYHLRIQGNFLTPILQWFSGYAHIPTLLKNRLDNYLSNNPKKTGDSKEIIKINVPDAHLIIWNDLHGAFHSLVRALKWLKQENIINDNLEIIKDNYFFIFNGDLINKSPYVLETLTLALTLIEKNPKKVFYTQGNHEKNGAWKNFSLRKELQIRIKNVTSLNNGIIPLEHEINTFFTSLPKAVYLQNTENPKNLILISHFGRNENTIDEEETGDFFLKTDAPPVDFYEITKKVATPTPLDIKAVIKSEHWKYSRRMKNGLALLDQEAGSITWSVFSSPTSVYQKYMNFFYDAFIILKAQNPIEKSTITLVNRDIRTKNNFKIHEPINIMSGIPISDPKCYSGKTEIKFGSTLGLEQGLPVISKQILRGAMVRINKQNSEEGGINGHIIRFIVKNDNCDVNSYS